MHDNLIKFIREVYKSSDFIPLHAPVFDKTDEYQIIKTLREGYASTAGPAVIEFENNIKEFINIENAVSTVNGTSALHIALKLSGVRTNTEVITQSFTFVGTCNAIRYCGADPIFIDINKRDLGMSGEILADFLESNCEIRNDGKCWNKITNKEVTSCLPMHSYGFPVNIDLIKQACEKFNINLIEDAAESFGCIYKKKISGSYGDVSTFSFHANDPNFILLVK